MHCSVCVCVCGHCHVCARVGPDTSVLTRAPVCLCSSYLSSWAGSFGARTPSHEMTSCFGGVFNLLLGNLSDFHKPPSPRTPLVARGALWGLQEVQLPPVLTEGFMGLSSLLASLLSSCLFCCFQINNRDLATKEQEPDFVIEFLTFASSNESLQI